MDPRKGQIISRSTNEYSVTGSIVHIPESFGFGSSMVEITITKVHSQRPDMHLQAGQRISVKY